MSREATKAAPTIEEHNAGVKQIIGLLKSAAAGMSTSCHAHGATAAKVKAIGDTKRIIRHLELDGIIASEDAGGIVTARDRVQRGRDAA